MLLCVLAILAIVIAVYGTWLFVWDDSPYRGVSFGKVIMTGPVFVFLGVVCLGLSMLTCVATAGIVGHDYEPGRTIQLQAISTDTAVQGSFFLGTGYVDEELVYYYYAENSDGSFYPDSISGSDTTIVETSEKPRIEVTDVTFPGWIIPDLDGDFNVYTHKYTVFVPEGSIKPMVNMDLPGGEPNE